MPNKVQPEWGTIIGDLEQRWSEGLPPELREWIWRESSAGRWFTAYDVRQNAPRAHESGAKRLVWVALGLLIALGLQHIPFGPPNEAFAIIATGWASAFVGYQLARTTGRSR
jgi:hypothetical protein